jgi:hypothetical protein
MKGETTIAPSCTPILDVNDEQHAGSTVGGVGVMVAGHFTRIRDHRLFVKGINARRQQKRSERHDVCDACDHGYFEEKIGLIHFERTDCTNVHVAGAMELESAVEVTRTHVLAGSIHKLAVHVDRVLRNRFAGFPGDRVFQSTKQSQKP